MTIICTVTTSAISEILQTSAFGGGNVTSDGGSAVTARGVCWSTSENPTISDSKTTDGTGNGTYDSQLTGLTANTLYYVRAYATNSQGTAYGAQVSFTTNPIELAIEVTEPSTNITVTQGESVTITWTGSGESAEMVGLRRDEDDTWDNGTGETGITTSQPISGTYSWNTEGVPVGTYYIGGEITSTTDYSYDYAPGTVTIEKQTNIETGTFTDSRDGNSYNWVKIGDQVWMAENLAYLPNVSPPSAESGNEPYIYVYGYSGTDIEAAKVTDNYATYGALYNWPAAMAGSSSSGSNPSGVQGVCPSNWHMPSDAEWNALRDYLINNGYGYGGSGDDIAKSMAAKTNWDSSPNAGSPGNDPDSNNSSGFSALPGGCRLGSGSFGLINKNGYFWSATENSTSDPTTEAWAFSISYYYSDRSFVSTAFKWGVYSVRCIKD